MATLLVIGFLTRVWDVGTPNRVVFDEVYYGNFAAAYNCTGVRIFDMHPPHAKLLIAAAMRLSSYDCDYEFGGGGQPFAPGISIEKIRLVPALGGIAAVVIIFFLLIQLGAGIPAAFLGGLAIALDNALVLQSRVLNLDYALISGIFGGLLFYLLAEKQQAKWLKYLLCAVAGGFCGLALGAKLSGLIGLGMVALTIMLNRTESTRREIASSSLYVLLGFAFIFVGGWLIHFKLLVLPTNENLEKFVKPTGNLLVDFWKQNLLILSSQVKFQGTHPGTSPWWTWPLMYKSVHYGGMVFKGNPTVWLGSLLMGLFLLFQTKWQNLPKFSEVKKSPYFILVIGFLGSYLPYVSVTRTMLIWNYLTPLIFLILIVFTYLGQSHLKSLTTKSSIIVFCLIAATISLGFYLVSPLTYGGEEFRSTYKIAWDLDQLVKKFFGL